MIIQLIRFVLVAFGALAGLAVANVIKWTEEIGYTQVTIVTLFVVLGMSIGYVIGSILGREVTAALERLETRVRAYAVTDLVLGAAGLLLGLLVALLASFLTRFIKIEWIVVLVDLFLYGLLAYVGVRLALVKRVDVRHAFPRFDPDLNAAGSSTPKYLDTSAIIDGRLADILRSGVVDGEMRVPRFVLAELQTLADSEDDLRRSRGRRGLDLLETLRAVPGGIQMFDADYPELRGVDEKLVALAQDTHGMIITVDSNLARVARLRDVRIFNVNELTLALRPALLPGDPVRVNVVREGKEPGQGVGYMEDGTMVVIAGAADSVGSEVNSEVTSVLQTAGGRMVFTKLGT
jgi:uncharacterized protein YacL